MKNITKTILISMWAMLIFTGCAKQYSYMPPKSEAGLQCVSQCQERKNTCRDIEAHRASKNKHACEVQADTEYSSCVTNAEDESYVCQKDAKDDYYACLKYASDRSICHEKPCKQERCVKQTCYNSPNYRNCESEFSICFQQCGGTIQEIE